MKYTEEWLEESRKRVYNRSMEENKKVHTSILKKVAQATLEHNKDENDLRVVYAKEFLKGQSI